MVTFIVQVSDREMPVVRRHERAVLAALGQTLVVTFGLPFPTPARVIVRPGVDTRLIGFDGDLPGLPMPDEVHGVITGVLYGVPTALHVTSHVLDLQWPAHA